MTHDYKEAQAKYTKLAELQIEIAIRELEDAKVALADGIYLDLLPVMRAVTQAERAIAGRDAVEWLEIEEQEEAKEPWLAA